VISDREALVRKGLRLSYATILYNLLEAIAAISAGILAGSIALLGFGLDSAVEVASSGAAQWRLRSDSDAMARKRVERTSRRIIGLSFLILAAYVTIESVKSLITRETPTSSQFGLIVLGGSVLIMPWLSHKKKAVARGLESKALEADATQTSLCAYLSAIALTGVALNTFFGLWWADSAAALVMVPIIAREGLEGLRGENQCADGC
jgi:divalent metal cation (Fe/Co/Zn/Cd) transporter